MNKPYVQTTRSEPRITFSALAKLLVPHTLDAHESIVKTCKYPPTAKVINYKDGIQWLIGIVVGDGKTGGTLEAHEREVVDIVKADPIRLPKGVTAARVPQSSAKWYLEDVEISMVPDLILSGPKGVGVLKFHVNKEPLPRGVGPTMAALLYHYESVERQTPNVVPEYCLVYDVRSKKFHKPSGTTSSLVDRARAACRFVAYAWDRV
ncbi:hypothetical protein [Sandaracinus amylolyticus]|uniref:hypothetical protein n=1 Tax=Sandaracinus amylolyticus TaxID=927083 RepID=UPI001F32ED1F|nr:hypothetical protein [Sandaracinus amylolyticus]UJR86674.1 Hypothetical protein I5071_87750 [Sandaracinus amylolyticus]